MIKILFSSLFLLSVSALAEDNINPQWSICEPAESVAARLGFSGDPKENSITYYDSIPVKYLDQGLTLRVKEKKNKGKSSVKMRFASASQKDGDACEWDRYGSKETYTCEVDNDSPDRNDPWTKDQVKFAEKYDQVDWNALHAFGPYSDLIWKSGKVAGYDAELDTVLPGKGLDQLVELSVKVPLSQNNETYEAVTAELKRLGVVLCERQESKTLRLFRELGLK